MQSKGSIWFSLALAAAFASTPIGAQSGPKGPPPAPAQLGAPSGLPQPPPSRDHSKETDAQRTVLGAYRLTYTLTEMDGDRKVGIHHYTLVLDADASPTWLKLGSKLPIATAEPQMKPLPPLTQFSYVEVGMNINASLRQFANGLELSSHFVQSAADPQQSLEKPPIIRQADLETTVLLNENKPTVLGDMLMPGSTHSLQIQVELTRLH